jgi:hypothetical protein
MRNQMVELHYRRPPQPDATAIKNRAGQILNEEIGLPVPKKEGEPKALLFFHKDHPVTYSDAKVPAQTAVLAAHGAISIEAYAEELQHSWACPNAEELLEGSEYTLLVTEMLTQQLASTDRVRLFHGVLQAVIEESQPEALVFKHTQQVIDPESYLTAAKDPPIRRPGSLNVRFYNVSNSDGDMLMDTRGLQEIGLHDLQCHFRDLPPDDVSRILFNSAIYIFENGPVIESGNTIEGIEPGSKWVCQFEDSLIEPERELLDLNPGGPHAAGNRE